MPDVRTTIAIGEDVYAGLKSQYRALGFSRMADLVNEAIRDYLRKREIEEKDRKMERASADPAYRAMLREIGDDFQAVDSEGIGSDY